jgi:CRISPR/Cas system-associated protein Csm6
MVDTHTSYQVHTEARGSHWVSWITRGAGTKPERGVLLVAASREEAEARARQWAEQTTY